MEHQIVHCERCGARCKVADRANEDARLLKHSTTPEGICADCGATLFLKKSPMAQFLDDPSKLLVSHVQAQFARLMQAGNADAKPEELHWQWIVDHWDLPFERQRPSRRKVK